ncbi:MAG: diphosphomevalonate decarboxylase [Woeseiaceae bacterium]|nr:diphosphomevalonate decarboxylase [Woeseiaceae bacterium]
MTASAEAHPNIALVKYWGKRDLARNLPAVGSLSVTLADLCTQMTVDFDAGDSDRLIINGQEAPAMLSRVTRCLDLVAGVDRPCATVESQCNFPIGAGLASSASAFAALTVAANAAAETGHEALVLAKIAGAASGSAARSLYGGVVELSAGDDEIDLTQLAEADEWPLQVVVAITAEEEKPLGSGAAMIRSAETSPFYSSWIERQDDDLALARDAVAVKDFVALGEVAEHNCLKMHSVMWSSRPPIVYWNQATLACMESVRLLRENGHHAFFTIDAGPQVKVFSMPDAVDIVEEVLRKTPGVLRMLRTGVGDGARLIPK